MTHRIRKLAFLGDYLPRQCGIATFTHDVRQAVASRYPEVDCLVVPVDDIPGGYDYPEEVRFQFQEQDLESYRRAADFLNFSNADVVCLQHEYGIFGGPAGSHVLALLRDLRMPTVTTLHTVLCDPDDDQRRVMVQLAELSARLVVMSERGREFLTETYGVPEDKIDLVPHGIPDMPFVDPNFYKDQFGVEGRQVALTFGLLSPNKGIEYVLRAVPEIVSEFPDLVYIVLGATHPAVAREQGEAYRLSLERLTHELGITKHVIFYNRFVELEELTEFIGSADIYITPYLNEAQITSGTLAYSFGCGKAVVSTPYWHAEELLAEERGVLIPFRDSEATARAVYELLGDDVRRHAMRKRAYMLGREMVWSNVAHLYLKSFDLARLHRPSRSLAIRAQEAKPKGLPRFRFDHLIQMTDSTGIVQHAKGFVPDFHEGYCSDDNARALILSVLLEELGEESPRIRALSPRYAAFLNYAFDGKRRRIRNHLGFDRQWREDERSEAEDALGRALWGLGTCVGRSQKRQLQSWAVMVFEELLPACLGATAPRSWAFSLIGIHEYLRRLAGDRLANDVRDELTTRLVEQFKHTASDEWVWFEDVVTYANAKLSHALILSGRWNDNPEALDVGLRSLRWLSEVQRSEEGHFRPIGNEGFYPRGKEPATFDQQPLEAHAMVSAAIEAYQTTNDDFWLHEAHRAFDWFLGRNDLGLPLYDAQTGGCCDGLHQDRVNENQGAESTLSLLLALAEMRLLENSLASFEEPVVPKGKVRF